MDQPPTTATLADFMAQQGQIGTLRFLTCGSVDDGKSTLIGRLLYDTKLILDDQLATLARDSSRHGTAGDDIDFALLVDGLEAEREQGITIDVAYRFFSTEKRRFIVADTPGHEQYTRNMATGASNAELAVVLVDARQGVLTQTRRHSFIVSLLGIRHVVLAVNKIDLVDFSQERFDEIVAFYRDAVSELGFQTLTAIPLSARYGDNMLAPSPRTPWYQGPSLVGYLESVDVSRSTEGEPFLMPVQWVNRPNQDFRGYAGTIAAGVVKPGDTLSVAASGKSSRVARIVTFDGDMPQAIAGQAVTLTLEDELDISRGDVLADAHHPAATANRLEADLVWLIEARMVPGRSYILKLASRSVPATVTRIVHRVNINTFEHQEAESLGVNDVARVAISLSAPICAAPFDELPELGGFILIDRLSNATIAVGMVREAIPAATNVTWYTMAVNKRARAEAKGQKPAAFWFTGLSGSGKSTIANLVETTLHNQGRHTFILDGDNVRHGLNKDLGFTEADRIENIRRAAEAAKLMVEAGLIVLVSFISPYRSDRQAARDLFEPGEFFEVFIDTPVDECRRRDPKGLYKKADAGLIKNFTGIDAPYEAPETPDLRLKTTNATPEELAEQVVDHMRACGLLG